MATNLALTLDRPTIYSTEEQWDTIAHRKACMQGNYNESQRLEIGAEVEYVCHTVGGMVKVRHNGQRIVINPNCCKELR